MLDDVDRVQIEVQRLMKAHPRDRIEKKDLMRRLGLSRTLVYSKPYKSINIAIDSHNESRVDQGTIVEPALPTSSREAELRRKNAGLEKEVAAYAQSIRNLALENIELRRALESRGNVTRISDFRPS